MLRAKFKSRPDLTMKYLRSFNQLQSTLRSTLGHYWSWITLLTALVYSSLLAYLVLVKDWSLLDTGLVMISIGLALTVTIVLIIMRIPEEDKKTFWQAFRNTWHRESRSFIGLLFFEGRNKWHHTLPT